MTKTFTMECRWCGPVELPNGRTAVTDHMATPEHRARQAAGLKAEAGLPDAPPPTADEWDEDEFDVAQALASVKEMDADIAEATIPTRADPDPPPRPIPLTADAGRRSSEPS